MTVGHELARGGRVLFAELQAALDERLRRNETEFRLAEKPSKRDLGSSRRLLLEHERAYRFRSDGEQDANEDWLCLDTTHISPRDAAEVIARLRAAAHVAPLFAMDLKALLPLLLPRAVVWCERVSTDAAANGSPLKETAMSDARAVGVKRPERVRVLVVDEIPMPNDRSLATSAAAIGFLGSTTAGLALGYSSSRTPT
jgi:hypothetical protein